MASNREKAAEVVGQHVTCGWSMCTRLRRHGSPRPPLDECPNTGPSCRDVAEGILDALDTASLPSNEYIELAPQYRFGVGRDDEFITISDNTARTTIRVPHDDVSGLITGLLMAKKED